MRKRTNKYKRKASQKNIKKPKATKIKASHEKRKATQKPKEKQTKTKKQANITKNNPNAK